MNKKNNTRKPVKRAKPTITFQPDDDVISKLELILRDKPVGYRSMVLNEALRLKLGAADKIQSEADAAYQQKLREGRASEQG